MARISDLDVQEIRQFFEDGLNQAQGADKRLKMRMRRKIRDEVFNLLTWEKPTPSAIMNRWEERLSDAFNVMPFGFKEDLFKMLVDKMQHPLKMRKSDQQDSLKTNRPFNPFK
jgi:hypothetical protein